MAARTYRQGPGRGHQPAHAVSATTNAVAWQRDWLTLGDTLLGKYAMGMVDGHPTGYPQWWNDVIGYKPLVR